MNLYLSHVMSHDHVVDFINPQSPSLPSAHVCNLTYYKHRLFLLSQDTYFLQISNPHEVKPQGNL